MARKKRETTVYTKQRNRIMSAILRLKKKGLQTDLYFPTEKELRSQGIKGQELAKLTRKLKNISSSQIKEYAYVPKQEWTEANFQPPFKQSDDSSFFDRVILSNWYAKLELNARGEAYPMLRVWMNNLIRQKGEHDTAIMIQRAEEEGNILDWTIVYNADRATMYVGTLIDYLPDEGIIYKEEQLDKLEYLKRLADALEQEEDWERPF